MFPKCKNPVGDGANLVLIFLFIFYFLGFKFLNYKHEFVIKTGMTSIPVRPERSIALVRSRIDLAFFFYTLLSSLIIKYKHWRIIAGSRFLD